MDKPSCLSFEFETFCDECNQFKPELDKYYISDNFIDIEHTTITCKHKYACERMYTLFAPTGKGTK